MRLVRDPANAVGVGSAMMVLAAIKPDVSVDTAMASDTVARTNCLMLKCLFATSLPFLPRVQTCLATGPFVESAMRAGMHNVGHV